MCPLPFPCPPLAQYATGPQTEDSQRPEDVADLFKVSRSSLYRALS
jgi:hypothetical protein